MSALLSALGNLAEAYGSASVYNQDIQRQLTDPERLNRIKEQNLQLQEMQRQLKTPAFKDIIQLPSGATAAVMVDPVTNQPSLKILNQPDTGNYDSLAQSVIAQLPEADQKRAQAEYQLGKMSGGPQAAIKALEGFVSKTPAATKNPKVLFNGGVPYAAQDPNTGQIYYDTATMPKDIAGEFAAAQKSYKDRLDQQEKVMQQRIGAAAAAQARAFQERRDLAGAKAATDAVVAQQRLQDSIDASKDHTNANDQVIVENFMQLSFGIQPRGIRGSPQWYDQMLQTARGSLGDVWAAKINALRGGGLLDEASRQSLLQSISFLAKNRADAAEAQAKMVDPNFQVPPLNVGETPPPPSGAEVVP